MIWEPLLSFFIKIFMWFKSSCFFWFTTEKWYSMKPHPRISGSPKRTKTLIFIRHGESRWNYAFNNPGGISVLRLIEMVLCEMQVFMQQDSHFLDSPLSSKGVDQAASLRDFLANNKCATGNRYINLLIGTKAVDSSKTKIVSSNLRRAISTLAIALKDRMDRTGELIHTLSELQEITRNVDGFCITPARETPRPSQLEFSLLDARGIDMPTLLARSVNASGHDGSKRIFGNGESRVAQFMSMVFQSSEECFIVGGHSLHFKEIFNGYLPRESTHHGKK